MTLRQVTCVFTHRVDAELLELLRNGGWHAETCNYVEDAPSSLQPGACHAGIVCIDAADAAIVATFRRLVTAHPHVPWIAIVPRGLVADAHIREFVADLCVDYQTKPLDAPRLLHALGHAAGMSRIMLGRDCVSQSDAGSTSIL